MKKKYLILLIIMSALIVSISAKGITPIASTPNAILGTSYYSTTQDGYWHQTASWNGTGIPPTSGSNNLNITINNNITYDGAVSGDPMDFQNKFTLTVKAGATLEISADVTINNNFTFIVEEGGNLIIHGDMSMGNVIEGTIDGAVLIDEDLTISGGGSSSAITGTGTLEVGGITTDPSGIVLPALINNERYLVVDGGDWTNQSSWSTASGGAGGATIPSDQSKVHIESGYDVTIPLTVMLQDLNISSGSVVTVSPGVTLEVTNSINNSGEIVLSASAAGSGALLYNGTSPGKVSFYRYISANGFQYVASPYTNAPYTDFFTTPYDPKNYNFYEYNETIIGPAVYGWTIKTAGSLESGKGYAIYYNKNYAYPLTGDTIRTGDYTIDVTNTNSGTASDDGWNLIGNPYAANIDANAFLNANNSGIIEGTIYYWDDDGSDGAGYSVSDYSTYTLAGGVAGDNGTIPNGYIAPGQAFFLKAYSNGALTFNNSMKAKTAGTTFNKTTSSEQSATKKSTNTKTTGASSESTQEEGFSNKGSDLRLVLTNQNNGYNETLIAFDERYTSEYDNFYDGKKKLQSGKIALYSISGDNRLAIQALPSNEELNVKLGIIANQAGTYTLSAKEIKNFDILTSINLYDKLLDKTTDLKKDSYTFEMQGGTDEERFVIRMEIQEQIFTTWQGSIDDDFFDVGKWSNGLPSIEKSVIIPSGKTASLNEYLQCRDLTIEAGAVMIVENNAELDISHDMEINSGRIGSWGILLNKKDLNKKAKINIDLDLSNYMPFSSPVSDGVITDVIGKNDGEANSYSPIKTQWGNILSESQTFETGNGYMILPDIYSNETVSFKGSLNSGTQEIYLNKGFNFIGNPYLSYLDWGSSESNEGWSLENNFNPSIWIATSKSNDLNNTSFGVYNRYANIGTNGVTRNINPMQAFWVFSENETAISVDNNARRISETESNTPTIDGIRLTVSGNSYSDEAIIGFSKDATDGYDYYDTYKMMATDFNYPQLYITNENKNYAINSVANIEWEEGSAKEFDLIFVAGTEGSYNIYLSNIGNLNKDLTISIIDDNGNVLELNNDTPYSFIYNTPFTNKSFKVRIEKKAQTTTTITTIDEEISLQNTEIYSHQKDVYVKVPDNINNAKVFIFDTSGRLVKGFDLKPGRNNFKLDENGIFIIKLINPQEVNTQKVMIW